MRVLQSKYFVGQTPEIKHDQIIYIKHKNRNSRKRFYVNEDLLFLAAAKEATTSAERTYIGP